MGFAELVAQVDRAVQVGLGGELVTYTPAEGPPVEVTAVFDRAFVLVKGTADAGVEASGPAVFCRLEDLPCDPEDDDPKITVRGVDYRVIERMPDGMGGVVLALRTIG